MTRDPLDDCWVIPTFHPAFLIRNQKMTLPTTLDLKKAQRIHWNDGPMMVPAWDRAEGPSPKLRQIAACLPTEDSIRAFFERYRGQRLSVDFEATMKGEPWCMGLWPAASAAATLDEDGICIPFRRQGGGNYWDDAETEARVMEEVRFFLTAQGWPKVGQNFVGFDGGYVGQGYYETAHSLVTKAWGYSVHGLEIDTMVGHAAVYAELPHSLAFQSSLVTDLGPYKIEVHEKQADDEDDDDGVKGFARIDQIDDFKLRLYCLRDCFAQAMSAHDLITAMA